MQFLIYEECFAELKTTHDKTLYMNEYQRQNQSETKWAIDEEKRKNFFVPYNYIYTLSQKKIGPKYSYINNIF